MLISNIVSLFFMHMTRAKADMGSSLVGFAGLIIWERALRSANSASSKDVSGCCKELLSAHQRWIVGLVTQGGGIIAHQKPNWSRERYGLEGLSLTASCARLVVCAGSVNNEFTIGDRKGYTLKKYQRTVMRGICHLICTSADGGLW